MSLLNPFTLLGVGSAGVLAAASLLLITDRRVRAENGRRAAALAPYKLANAAGARQADVTRKATRDWSGLLTRCRIDRHRPDLYPMRWWLLVVLSGVIAVIVAGLLSFFVGLAAWVGVPVFWFVLVRFVFGYFRRRRTNLLYEQLPEALAMIVRSVRAGLPVPEALRIVGEEGQWPTSLEFRALHDETKLGASLAECLMRLAERCSLLEYRFFAVALTLQSQSGGSLAETLENLADVVRKRISLKQRAIALSSEARLTMYVLAALPFIAGTALTVVAPDYIAVLFNERLGRMILMGGAIELALGIVSMQLIIRNAVS